ncbi:MAG: benzoylformate decarboxylase [Sphingomonas sp.]
MPNVRDAAYAVFQHFGVDALFGNPGSTELPMLQAMPSDIAYVLGLNEAVVVAMADGYAQATGRAALVNLHSAAGTGNGLGSLFTAYRGGAPLVITAGQQARSLLPRDPFLGAERATEFPRPYVKWAAEPLRAQDVPAALIRAFHIALTPPTGPVFVSIPVDDWDRDCPLPTLPILSLTCFPDSAGIASIAGMLDKATRPALVLGAGIARCGAWDQAIALAEKTGADVWVAPLTGREVFPENHSRFAGFLPGYEERLVALLNGYDMVLVAGAPAFTWHAEGGDSVWPEGTGMALLSDDPQHLAILPRGIGVLGDVRAGLRALVEHVRQREAPVRTARHPIPPAASALTPAHVMARIAALRPDGAIIVEEAPTARDAMHDHLPVTQAGGFYTTPAGGLGYGLPAAVGIARACPGNKVICLLGDGSSMYTSQGLWSAADQQADVSFIILNNGGYAALNNFARRFGLDELPGTTIAGIDFVGLAESHGVPGRRIAAVEELDLDLAWAFQTSGPTLLEVRLL